MVDSKGGSYDVEENENENPDHLAPISQHVERWSAALRRVSLEIHDHPELRYKETHAHDVLTRFVAAQAGWTLTPSAYGIETAFVAVFDSGRKGPVASFNAEYGNFRTAMASEFTI